MAEEFRISIGAELNANSLSSVQSQLQNLTNNTYRARIDLDTSRVQSQLNSIRRQINNLSRVKITLNGGSVGGSGGGGLTNNINQMQWAFKQMLSLQKEIGNTKIKIGGISNTKEAQNQIKTLVSQLKQLEADYQTIQKTFNMGNLSTEQWSQLQTVLDNTKTKLEQVKSKVTDVREKLANSISLKFDNGTFSNQLSKVTSDMGKIKTQSQEVMSSFANLENAYNELSIAAKNYQNANNQSNLDILINKNKEYQKALKETQNQININLRAEQDSANASQLRVSKDAFSAQIDAWLKRNSAATKMFGAELQNIKRQIQSVDATGLKNLQTQFQEIIYKAQAAGVATMSLGDKFKASFSRLTTYFSGMYLIMKSIQALKDMANNVIEIDTAMTELKKVTDETAMSYNNFLNNSASVAKEIGSTISGIVNSTADFARLGYSFDEAQGLAKVANIYAVVGDDIKGVDEATEHIISTMKSFKIEASEAISIVDKFNETGNNFAISSGGVGTALEKSASSLAAANNTLDESIALITAANTVVQNPDVVGRMLPT